MKNYLIAMSLIACVAGGSSCLHAAPVSLEEETSFSKRVVLKKPSSPLKSVLFEYADGVKKALPYLAISALFSWLPGAEAQDSAWGKLGCDLAGGRGIQLPDGRKICCLNCG